MDDKQLVDLYFERSECAISETDNKYGKYLRYIAHNILNDRLDTEECVNDTYLSAWNVIPPQRPSRLQAFLAKITRNLALDRHRINTAGKRGGLGADVALDELLGCFGGDESDRIVDSIVLSTLINSFLADLSPDDRVIFVQRYWYFCPVSEIAENLGAGQSRVKMSLLRSRNKLRDILEKEGVPV